MDSGQQGGLLRSHTEGYQYHPPGFAAWSRPEWTVVSGGHSDRLQAVEAAYRARGSRVLNTADCGAVSVSIAEGDVSLDCWRTPAPAP